MEWIKNLLQPEIIKLREWGKINKNIPMGYIFWSISIFTFSIGLLYYFYAFNFSNNSSSVNNILTFNIYISNFFPEIASRSIKGEELYRNGYYIQYIAGISIFASMIVTMLSLFIISTLNLWTNYDDSHYSSIKINLFFIVFFILVSLMVYDSYFIVQHHQKYTYRSIFITINYISISLFFSIIIISSIDRLVFWFRSKFSTSKAK